jgi:hypothetical protein
MRQSNRAGFEKYTKKTRKEQFLEKMMLYCTGTRRGCGVTRPMRTSKRC